jgi:hypothetical protein
MSVNSIGSSGDITQVAARLMDTVDANKDGQLSKEEFGMFLNSLLQGLSKTSPTSPSSATIASTVLTRAASTAPAYAPIPGFDSGKMNDLTHTTPKYQFARAVQDLGLLGAPTTSNLQPIVDALNKNGGKAKVMGSDTIDFGDGFGAVDVIFSVGDAAARWQWVPTT